jgi:hypothetical protein
MTNQCDQDVRRQALAFAAFDSRKSVLDGVGGGGAVRRAARSGGTPGAITPQAFVVSITA